MFFFKFVSLISVAALVSAQIVDVPCDGVIIPKDGPEGFGNSYRAGNRVDVQFNAAASQQGFETTITKDLAGPVQIVVKYTKGSADDKIRITIRVVNNSGKPVIAQLAVYLSLSQGPYELFDAHAYDVIGLQCAEVAAYKATGPVTIQAYHPSP